MAKVIKMSSENDIICMCGYRPDDECNGFCKANDGVCECKSSYKPCHFCLIREGWEEEKWGPKTEDLEPTDEEIKAERNAIWAEEDTCDCLCGTLAEDRPCGFCVLRDAVGIAEAATAEAVAAETVAVEAVARASVAKAHATEALRRAKEALATEGMA